LAREEKGGKPKSQASRGGGHIEDGQTKQKTKKTKKGNEYILLGYGGQEREASMPKRELKNEYSDRHEGGKKDELQFLESCCCCCCLLLVPNISLHLHNSLFGY
jgi:hypothetical protein